MCEWRSTHAHKDLIICQTNSGPELRTVWRWDEIDVNEWHTVAVIIDDVCHQRQKDGDNSSLPAVLSVACIIQLMQGLFMDTYHVDYTRPPMQRQCPQVLRIPNQPPDVMSAGYATKPQDGAPPVVVLTDEQEAAVQEHARQRDKVLGSGLTSEAHSMPMADTATYDVEGLLVRLDSTDYCLILVSEAGRHSRVVPAILDIRFEVLLTDAKAAAHIAQGYYADLANINYIDR